MTPTPYVGVIILYTKDKVLTEWDERALKKKICMWLGQGPVPVSVSRIQDRAGDMPIRYNAVGFHCRTAMGCGSGCPK